MKEKYPRRTPISYELRKVFDELREGQRKISNLANFVFTRKGRPIKSIRTAWKKAIEQAGIDNLTAHDIRRTAITSWTALGIPRDVVMAASGYKPNGVHDQYINFSDEQLIQAFQKAGLLDAPAKRKKAAVAL